MRILKRLRLNTLLSVIFVSALPFSAQSAFDDTLLDDLVLNAAPRINESAVGPWEIDPVSQLSSPSIDSYRHFYLSDNSDISLGLIEDILQAGHHGVPLETLSVERAINSFEAGLDEDATNYISLLGIGDFRLPIIEGTTPSFWAVCVEGIIAASALPLQAAGWLFGSAAIGLCVVGRNRRVKKPLK
jgi:hypothetical protein